MKFLFIFLFISVHAFAHGGAEAPKSSKGVLEYSEEKGFKPSEQAITRFKISTVKLQKSDTVQVPLSALVYALGDVSVFRKRDGYYKRINVALKSKDSKSASVHSEELKVSDEVTVRGADYLRVIEMDFSDAEKEEGHHHD